MNHVVIGDDTFPTCKVGNKGEKQMRKDSEILQIWPLAKSARWTREGNLIVTLSGGEKIRTTRAWYGKPLPQIRVGGHAHYVLPD